MASSSLQHHLVAQSLNQQGRSHIPGQSVQQAGRSHSPGQSVQQVGDPAAIQLPGAYRFPSVFPSDRQNNLRLSESSNPSPMLIRSSSPLSGIQTQQWGTKVAVGQAAEATGSTQPLSRVQTC